jgi:nucleotide-binding universal stress UspA family protein
MLRIQHVLFPTDRTAWSEVVFAHAARFAQRHGATLHILTVSVGGGGDEGTLVTAPPGASDDFASRLHEAAADAVGFDVVHADLSAPSVPRGILDYTERVDADLIVMATHGRRGVDHALIGSIAEAVVRRAPCPVLTVRPTAEHTETGTHRILVPVDLSVHARRALAHAREIAEESGAEVHLLHVAQSFPDYGTAETPPGSETLSDSERREVETALEEIAGEVLGDDLPVRLHVEAGLGNPALFVLDLAERLDIDLVVLGSHGRSGIRRFWLGSVTEKVVQLAPCPVFTVKVFGKSLLPSDVTEAEESHA